jgi:small subunit ribosomal protein S6
MNNYELLYIISNQYTEDEAKVIKNKVDAMLIASGAILGRQEDMGKKKLAYPIDHVAHGYYLLSEFELEDGSKLKIINDNLRLDKEILRAQIISKRKTTAEDLEKARKREAAGLKHKIESEKAKAEAEETKTGKPEEAKTDKKVNIKDLDEKLDEILKTDDLV